MRTAGPGLAFVEIELVYIIDPLLLLLLLPVMDLGHSLTLFPQRWLETALLSTAHAYQGETDSRSGAKARRRLFCWGPFVAMTLLWQVEVKQL